MTVIKFVHKGDFKNTEDYLNQLHPINILIY